MIQLSNRIPEADWSCSICLNLMDGHEETNGPVCISKRCMHVFHRSCIEQSITQKRSCPLCRHQIGLIFLVDNPEHEEQCRIWDSNRNGYTLEAAFQRKYNSNPELIGLMAADILRPEALQGSRWNPELTSEDKSKYYYECVHNNYPPAEIENALSPVLDRISDSFAEMRASNAEMRVKLSQVRAKRRKIKIENMCWCILGITAFAIYSYNKANTEGLGFWNKRATSQIIGKSISSVVP